MLTALLIVACGPGLVFAIGSWSIFRPDGPRLGGPATPPEEDVYESGDLGV